MRLTKLNGVGNAKAERLRENGYQQLEDVAFATLLHFDQVKNASPDLIRQAQAKLADHPDIGYRIDQPMLNPDAMGTYWCDDCGQHFVRPGDVSKDRHNCRRSAKLGGRR